VSTFSLSATTNRCDTQQPSVRVQEFHSMERDDFLRKIFFSLKDAEVNIYNFSMICSKISSLIIKRGSHNVNGLTPCCTKMAHCASTDHLHCHLKYCPCLRDWELFSYLINSIDQFR
jgi:hypothetical protein